MINNEKNLMVIKSDSSNSIMLLSKERNDKIKRAKKKTLKLALLIGK
jgi:hypothetical protein